MKELILAQLEEKWAKEIAKQYKANPEKIKNSNIEEDVKKIVENAAVRAFFGSSGITKTDIRDILKRIRINLNIDSAQAAIPPEKVLEIHPVNIPHNSIVNEKKIKQKMNEKKDFIFPLLLFTLLANLVIGTMLYAILGWKNSTLRFNYWFLLIMDLIGIVGILWLFKSYILIKKEKLRALRAKEESKNIENIEN